MSHFKNAIKGKQFKCDGCHKIIKGENIVLKPVKQEAAMTSLLLSFRYVDKKGKIMGGVSAPKKGDSTMYCPHCNTEHPFGLEEVIK